MFTAANSTIARTVVATLGTALCAGLCLLAATAPAAADTMPAPTRSAVVRYADLTLASPQGRVAFDRRVRAAARGVCTNGRGAVQAQREEDRCIRRALVTANAQAIAS